MKKAKYTNNRKYRDFIDEEEETFPKKRSILLKKKKSILQKVIAFFKGK